jgi:hypothetical protein
VLTAIAASKDWSSDGRLSAAAATHDAAPARRCARVSGRWLNRNYVTVGGLVGAGASPDIQYSLSVTERSPDPCGDPRLGASRHGVSGSDGVVQMRAGLVAASLAVTTGRRLAGRRCLECSVTRASFHHVGRVAFRRSANDHLCASPLFLDKRGDSLVAALRGVEGGDTAGYPLSCICTRWKATVIRTAEFRNFAGLLST